MSNEQASLKALQTIPGVGKAVAQDLYELGYASIEDLKEQDPEEIYVRHNTLKGSVQDICMLYTFRCAVYFASTPSNEQDPQKLKWWKWMDSEKMRSVEKDKQIRQQKKC